MEVEELITALNKSNIDMKAQEEIIVTLNRYEDAQEPEHFTVLETCKEDMNIQFKDEQKILAGINEFTDDQMEHIARDVEDQLLEYYWDALELAVEAELEAAEGK